MALSSVSMEQSNERALQFKRSTKYKTLMQRLKLETF